MLTFCLVSLGVILGGAGVFVFIFLIAARNLSKPYDDTRKGG